MSLELHVIGPGLGLPDVSPFCTKGITYLKMTGIEGTVRIGDMRKAPKGKMPFILLDGEKQGDTRFFIRTLQKRFPEQALEEPEGKDLALSTAFQALLEEHLYFLLVYFRWVDGWGQYKPVIEQVLRRGGVPKLLTGLLSPQLRKGVTKSLYGQGTGRHSKEELLVIAGEHFAALAEQLGDKEFLLGDSPQIIDASMYAMLSGALCPQFPSPIRDLLLQFPSLVAYCERIEARYFTESA